MDLKKIFIKNACPTKIGGQAILEGLMMRAELLSIAIRKPSGDIHLSVEPLKPAGKWKDPGATRDHGLYRFLIQGTGILLYSAEVLETFTDDEGKSPLRKDKTTLWLEKHFWRKGRAERDALPLSHHGRGADGGGVYHSSHLSDQRAKEWGGIKTRLP